MKRLFAVLMLILMIVVPYAVAFATSDVIAEPAPANFQEFLSTLLYSFLAAAVPIITGYLTVLFNAWRKKIWGDKYGTEIQTGVSAATDMIYAAVVAVNQEYVDELKGKNIFSEKAQADARARAKEKAKALITDVSKEAVISLYGSFEKWLDLVLEKAVTDAKNAKVAAEPVIRTGEATTL